MQLIDVRESCVWVRQLVSLHHPSHGNACVKLRCREPGMAEQLSDSLKGSATIAHVRGASMMQQAGMPPNRIKASGICDSFQNAPDAANVQAFN